MIFHWRLQMEMLKFFEHETSNLRVVILQMLCLERFYREENYNENRPHFIKDGKEHIRDDKLQSFQNKK